MKRLFCILLLALVVFLPLAETVSAEANDSVRDEEPTRGRVVIVEDVEIWLSTTCKIIINGTYEKSSTSAYNIDLTATKVGYCYYYSCEYEPYGTKVKITIYYKLDSYSPILPTDPVYV